MACKNERRTEEKSWWFFKELKSQIVRFKAIIKWFCLKYGTTEQVKIPRKRITRNIRK